MPSKTTKPSSQSKSRKSYRNNTQYRTPAAVQPNDRLCSPGRQALPPPPPNLMLTPMQTLQLPPLTVQMTNTTKFGGENNSSSSSMPFERDSSSTSLLGMGMGMVPRDANASSCCMLTKAKGKANPSEGGSSSASSMATGNLDSSDMGTIVLFKREMSESMYSVLKHQCEMTKTMGRAEVMSAEMDDWHLKAVLWITVGVTLLVTVMVFAMITVAVVNEPVENGTSWSTTTTESSFARAHGEGYNELYDSNEWFV